MEREWRAGAHGAPPLSDLPRTSILTDDVRRQILAIVVATLERGPVDERAVRDLATALEVHAATFGLGRPVEVLLR